MITVRLLLVLFSAAALAGAQTDPNFTWKGEVDGIIVLHIHGQRVEIEYRQGAPVQRQSYRFNDALPDSSQDVRLEVLESRGSVNITQQPRADNNYTADITIEDRQDGSFPYSIALYWDDAAPLAGRRDHLTWTGVVTGEVIVTCRAERCESAVQSGGPVGRERVKFTRPLPDSGVRVTLDDTEGRAEIRLLERPSARNGYAAKVLVRALPGGGACSFVLSWHRLRTPK